MRNAFLDSIFELADLWTNGVSAEEYASFLKIVHFHLTEEEGGELVWKTAALPGGFHTDEVPDEPNDPTAGRPSLRGLQLSLSGMSRHRKLNRKMKPNPPPERAKRAIDHREVRAHPQNRGRGAVFQPAPSQRVVTVWVG